MFSGTALPYCIWQFLSESESSVPTEFEIYRDLRFDFHWISIEQVRFVLPLFDCILGRLQQRVPDSTSRLTTSPVLLMRVAV
jgi:hypothetical protein